MKFVNQKLFILLALLLPLSSSAGQVETRGIHASTSAVAESPEVLIEQIITDVFTAIRAQKASRAELELIAEKFIAPNCDFERMTAFAVGKAWRTATQAEREELVNEFRSLLLWLYSATINEYADYAYRITGRPPVSTATGTTVRVEFRKAGAAGSTPTNINVYLEKGADSRWKIVDLSVDGVSILQSYRAGFQNEIKNNGIRGLIEQLKKKNSRSNQ